MTAECFFFKQVFAEGDDSVKSPLEGMFEGSSSETTVRNMHLSWLHYLLKWQKCTKFYVSSLLQIKTALFREMRSGPDLWSGLAEMWAYIHHWRWRRCRLSLCRNGRNGCAIIRWPGAQIKVLMFWFTHLITSRKRKWSWWNGSWDYNAFLSKLNDCVQKSGV